MVDLLIPTDAEQTVMDELSPFYTIATSIPGSTKPPAFLRVTSVGGFQRDLVSDSFTVVLEAFAAKELAARQLLASAIARLQRRQTLESMMGSTPCYRIQISALPSNFPLVTVPTHKRYTSTLVIDLRRQSVPL